MPRFSIIVPVMGIEGLFDDTLASVLRHRPDDCEIIVVHDGTYRNPYDLGDEVRLVATDQRPNLVRFFNESVSHATGEFIAWLRPGITVDENWQLPIEEAFSSRDVASVSPAIVSPSKPTRLITAGVTHNFAFHRQLAGNGQRLASSRTSRLLPIGPTSWAAFYRTSALQKFSGIDSRIDPHYLDLEIGLTLNRLGYRSQFASECITYHDFPKMILRESELPHGLSSQRAILRHTGTTDFGRSLVSFLQEICASPFSTWQFGHAWSRFGARRFKDIDSDFARQILAIKRSQQLDVDFAEPTITRRAA